MAAKPSPGSLPVVAERLMALIEKVNGQIERALDEDDARSFSMLSRTLNQSLAQLGKALPSPDDERDVVHVKRSEIEGAGARALDKLTDLVERIRGERAGLPKCPTCGGPVGVVESDPANASPLRLVLEKVATLPTPAVKP